MAFAGLGVIALDIANVDEFGDDGDGELGGVFAPNLRPMGRLTCSHCFSVRPAARTIS